MDEEDKPLTAKQQRFCEEYQIDLNATQAALRANYAASSVRWTGCTNLTKPNVKKEIQRLKALVSQKTAITVEWVVNNLKEVAERCMNAIPVLDDDGKEIGEWQFEHSGANKALQLLGMHVGAFEADNAQKAPEIRTYTIKELKVLVMEGEGRDKRIAETGTGIAV